MEVNQTKCWIATGGHISEKEWVELLRPLPLDADRVAVYRAIEVAIGEYIGGADRDRRLHDIWQQIGRDAGSQIVSRFRKYCETVLQLEMFPDPETKALLSHVAGLEQALGNAPLPTRVEADARRAVHLATARRGRFMSGVALAWTGPGKGQLSISEAGPFVRFLSSIYERVIEGQSLNGAGVKKFVKREQARRVVLNSIAVTSAVRAGMRVDETKITLRDAPGQSTS